jgi:hypothetical protein
MIPGAFPDHFVTPEDKIRDLCIRVLAAETDEAANRILPEMEGISQFHTAKVLG